ncbi:MAG: hypothetical protein PGN33_22020 [Methylobacterium radiotolerans]
MRTLIFLAALAVAGPAAAGPMDGARWSADTVERKGVDEMTTNLMFRRTGPGEWSVSARCETRDTRTGRWRARTGQGAAVRSMGLILIDAGKVGRMVLSERSAELFGNAPGCAQGTVDLGTGD